MLKSVPVSLATCSSVPNTPLAVVLCVVSFIAFLMPVLRLVILRMLFCLFGVLRLIFCHVRRPPMGRSASSNMVSDGTCPPTTALAAESADSLHSMYVCDLILLMCVWRCFVSLARSI